MTNPVKQNLRRIASIFLPLLGSVVTLMILMRSLFFSPGYIIYRDLFPGQLYYPMLWHSQGSFMALENYKFVTFTGLFLPLMGLGLDVYEKAVYASAMLIAFLAFYTLAHHLLRCIMEGSFSWSGRHFSSAVAAFIYVANPAAANIFFDFSLFVGYAFGLMAPLTENASSPLILFLSFFPLTAPVVMMMRLTNGSVPLWQLLVAAGMLFVLAVYLLRAVAALFHAQNLLSGQPFSLRRYFGVMLGKQ